MVKKAFCSALLALLSACSDEPIEPLVYGAIPWPGYEPAFLARELGFLDVDRVHLAEFTNTSDVVRAFRNRRLHVAGLTLDEALGLRKNVPDLQVFMMVDVSHGADVLLVNSNIKNLGQLKGKRVGVEDSALGAYFLRLILRAAKLSVDDIHALSFPLDEHVSAYREGAVDAVVTFGVAHDILLKLGAVELFNSTQVPGKIVDVLVVRAADADRFSTDLRSFTRSWFRALHVMQNDPARAYPLIALREQTKVASVEHTIRKLILFDQRQNQIHLSGNPSQLHSTANELQNILKEAKLNVGSDDLSQLVNSRFIVEAGID